MSDQQNEQTGAPPTPKKARPISGKQAKRKKFYLLLVGPDEWYRLRRADLPTLFFEGLLPTPILRAVDGFQRMRSQFQGDDIADALSQISAEDRAAFVELLRRAAVAVVMTPRLTHSKKAAAADDDLLWVGGLTDIESEIQARQASGLPPLEESGDVALPVLMQIWRAVMSEGGIVVMPDDDATEFRPLEPELPVPPVPDERGVRSEAVVVDSPAVAHVGAVPETTRKVRFLTTQ